VWGGLDRRGEKREEREGEDVALHRGTVVKIKFKVSPPGNTCSRSKSALSAT